MHLQEFLLLIISCQKNKGLSLSSVISSITGLKQDGIICRIVDILFIFICFGGLSITLGVSVPLVTEIFCNVIGIQPSFIINFLIIVVISIVYSFSSYIGIQKECQNSRLEYKISYNFPCSSSCFWTNVIYN